MKFLRYSIIMFLGLVELHLGLTDFSDIFDDPIEQLIAYPLVIGHKNFHWFVDLLFSIGRDALCTLGKF